MCHYGARCRFIHSRDPSSVEESATFEPLVEPMAFRRVFSGFGPSSPSVLGMPSIPIPGPALLGTSPQTPPLASTVPMAQDTALGLVAPETEVNLAASTFELPSPRPRLPVFANMVMAM